MLILATEDSSVTSLCKKYLQSTILRLMLSRTRVKVWPTITLLIRVTSILSRSYMRVKATILIREHSLYKQTRLVDSPKFNIKISLAHTRFLRTYIIILPIFRLIMELQFWTLDKSTTRYITRTILLLLTAKQSQIKVLWFSPRRMGRKILLNRDKTWAKLSMGRMPIKPKLLSPTNPSLAHPEV